MWGLSQNLIYGFYMDSKARKSQFTFQSDLTDTVYQCLGKAFKVHEAFHDTQTNTTIFRRFKYEETHSMCSASTFSHVEGVSKRRTFNIDNSDTSLLIKSLANFSLKANDASPNTEVPMEIDSSGNTSLNLSSELEQPIKRVLCNKQNLFKETTLKTETKTAKQGSVLGHSYFYVALIVLICSISMAFLIIGYNFFISGNQEIQLESIKQDLNTVAYQTSAINVIIETFEHKHLWHKPVKILPFIGSSGVGKTFTANILKRNFVPSRIYEINAQNLQNDNKQKDVFDTLSTSYCNLIIIDNLSATDCDRVIHFISRIPDKHKVLVIPIFNVQRSLDGWNYVIHREDYVLIQKAFDDSGFYYELVLFNILKVEMLEEWLRRKFRKLNIESDRQSQLIMSLIDPIQAERKGFKGINTNLLLALESNH